MKTSTLEMSEAYTKIKEKFDEWGDNSQCLVENQATLFPKFTNADDHVAQCLFSVD